MYWSSSRDFSIPKNENFEIKPTNNSQTGKPGGLEGKY